MAILNLFGSLPASAFLSHDDEPFLEILSSKVNRVRFVGLQRLLVIKYNL